MMKEALRNAATWAEVEGLLRAGMSGEDVPEEIERRIEAARRWHAFVDRVMTDLKAQR